MRNYSLALRKVNDWRRKPTVTFSPSKPKAPKRAHTWKNTTKDNNYDILEAAEKTRRVYAKYSCLPVLLSVLLSVSVAVSVPAQVSVRTSVPAHSIRLFEASTCSYFFVFFNFISRLTYTTSICDFFLYRKKLYASPQYFFIFLGDHIFYIFVCHGEVFCG